MYPITISDQSITLGLTLIGSISPLLTFAYLWQIKEWRIDRLFEHLRAEGWIKQIYGTVRPAATGIFLLLALAKILPWSEAAFWLLIIFGLLTVIQIGLNKQPKPVWTQKARVLCATTAIFSAVLAWILPPVIAPLIVLFQPDILTVSWLLWYPVDRMLKKRIMQRAMALRAKHPELTVIGITGSVGKTTTKELLRHVLADKQPLVTPAHVNSDMGVAQWMIKQLESNEEPSMMIVEMGAYRMGEIALLCDIAQPNIGVLTFIGSQHIALFGSQEKLCKAKGELIDSLPADGHAFLNADNDLCRSVAEKAPCPVTMVGTGGSADLEAFDIEEHSTGVRFRAGDTAFHTQLHGTHNVTNMLLSIAVAQKLGMRDADIASKIKSFTPPSKTFTVRQEAGISILDDTHNASPASFKAAIAWARSQPAKEKVLLTSGLIELGQQQDDVHAELGALCSDVFDRVIFLSERRAMAFERGYKKPVELFSANTEAVSSDALLVCEGRMQQTTIERMIPRA